MRHTLHILLPVTAAILLLASCSTTRRLAPGETLYTGTKAIKYDMPRDSTLAAGIKTDIAQTVDVAPNNYWSLVGWRYPFPLGLWVYNNWNDPGHGFKHWLYNKLVAQPVLVSDVRPELRTHMIKQVLENNGYFAGTATYDLVSGKNPRKASVQYTVTPGAPYRFNTVVPPADTTRLLAVIDTLVQQNAYLKAGSRYSTDSLSVARNNITNALRNKGYYFFRPDYIEYLADTVSNPGRVNLRVDLANNLPWFLLEPYRTGRITMVLHRNNNRGRTDTLQVGNVTLLQQMPSRIRHSVITENVRFRPGKIFKVRDMDRTQNYLSRLGIFSAVNISAMPDTTATSPILDVTVDCTLDKPLEASIEVNVSSKSNSYLGPGLTLGLTNRNIFGGGEQLSVQLTGAYEWQTGKNSRGNVFNSYEGALTASLAFPRLLAPRFIPRRRREINWTRIQLNADILNRPHYFKMSQFNTGISYEWQATRHSWLSLTPFKLTYTKLMHTTADFDSIMAANPAVAQSFMSQFIPQMNLTYNRDRALDNNNRLSWQFTAQQAGNLFWAIYEACGKKGEKKLFGTPFSQFVKGSAQLVWSRRITGDSWLVTRGAVGAAHAYGNSSTVPYSEQFYCGGANSVRAFTVRSLGPGSYRAPRDQPGEYFDQTGTFKFEANVEYRFPIYGILHGAAFVDSGNVWLLKNDPARPGGQLKASSFLKDLALGTGVGLRLDLDMIVVRGDLGIGIHAPYDTGRRGYYNMTSFGNSLAFHLAIGYPF